MNREKENACDLELLLHRIKFTDWYATQVDRGIAIFVRGADTPSMVLHPPDAWGDRWTWNLCDGGIYFKRT